ncbi:bifunctional diaminohydroxyphosphoribosylaminopyrimidine deaminase/5-amino-6-(5-phosphoribosylamino)uracil reductase RibD [Jeotgalibacillus sp. R-1-5s-1]|uniref:bifunctional diaminohydroxyphosphoribosylaminopyrimidine deaminase/5-amino-6-(5-phosphoribosylamino)uracil reductase RibD n=1 Tax=Jeotgalibacillus sp. R-1-5s-1 TaxID=2555897 RepID=UPI0010698F1E|nr:bifunctional diaminohydroxyphosphoribosylaminopyrimidine deaminase/5-amino-6-(5-phosphoribosylamino)uracil reductase RibD [Jeotgalibacillus sp. R-1-5s-1]TFE03299.1 bifunctional diaminohydroxyphosphoribosylaminopyrimidine deaminase/5-amino-6-(5-phosphoribosylamino)uracil reductase RibD [Jeotgalibacillus sp. R-1-5s-1]
MHEKWMKMAISMAEALQGQTSPNPTVGSVVVKNGRVIGMGAHLKAGEGHAEVNAIRQAGDQAEGATIYVTLEPCSHYGKTPPCAELIIEKKLRTVVIGSKDPNPQVSGRGIKKLKEAGIEVITGICEDETDKLNEFFFYSMQNRRPFVTLKTAVSLDGKTATKTGHSKWITGSLAREDVHKDRHLHDAILVGVNTVKKDDPSLTVRLTGGGVSPVRVVLDHHLTTPEHAKIIQESSADTLIICSSQAPVEKEKQLTAFSHVSVVRLNEPSISISRVMEVLHASQIHSVYVEGGANVHTSFLESGFADRVITYIAPKIITGEEALTTFAGAGIEHMNQAYELEFENVIKLGPGLKITAVLKETE